jgi:phosphonate transport system ATP-binding protein
VSLHQVEYGIKYCPRTIALKSGEVVYDGPSRALTPAFLNGIYGAESSDLFQPARAEPAPGRTDEGPFASGGLQPLPAAVM